MNYHSVKDSGSRRAFLTGSVRDARVGKGRYDLLPVCAIRRLAQHYENGSRKYGDRNWELGQPSSVYMDCARRHLDMYLEGHRDEDHLAAAMWNIAGLIFNETMIERGIYDPGLNDLPDHTSPEGFERTVRSRYRRMPGREDPGVDDVVDGDEVYP